MKIVGLQIESFKKIKCFKLEPKGNVIKVTGANASGKTSALDAVYAALVGARGGPIAPVRRGDGKASVRVDIGEDVGEIRITRRWVEGSSAQGEMWVETMDGKRYGRPQDFLNNLMGRISFDPLAFVRMKQADQIQELRSLLGVDKELADLRAKEQADYQQRTERTKYLKQLEAQRLALQFPQNLPREKRNIQAMTDELTGVVEFNSEIERAKLERDRMQRELASFREAIANQERNAAALDRQLKELRKAIAENVATAKQSQAVYDKLPPLAEPKDARKINEEIVTARAVNLAIDQRNRAEDKDAEIATVTKEVDGLNASLDAVRNAQADLVAGADYPIEGLGFGEDGVLYNGLPFEQASSAEQIRVSVAMGMAGNPRLRVMFIKEGSLLDDAGMAMLEQMATEHDYQVLMELVDTTGKVGVYLVDGEIAAVNEPDVPEPPKPRKKTAKKVVPIQGELIK